MTTSISNEILNYDEMVEADPLEKVAAFQNMLCNACQIQNAGQCVKDNGECPVHTVGRAYKTAS
ncbi:MAG: hypothetical protein ACXVIG_04310 [Halobacteriota archaeon]